MKICKYLLFIITIIGISITFLSPNIAFSQNSHVNINKDTITTSKQIDTTLLNRHSPTKATIMSAIVPGLGQAYNKKYWKIPVIYTGFAILGYFISTNHNQYSHYKTLYYNAMDTVKDINKYTVTQDITNLITLKNYYRRNFELSCIVTGVLYMLNILDAAVDANLYDFDVSDNLALNIKPINNIYPNNTYLGLSLTFK
ncbi:MAG: DUF5683 domain-containing protein, partial [Bacteroidota bacterium]|nr:DUF5683 domain-containing protein [Bacteroidota bacterium]